MNPMLTMMPETATVRLGASTSLVADNRPRQTGGIFVSPLWREAGSGNAPACPLTGATSRRQGGLAASLAACFNALVEANMQDLIPISSRTVAGTPTQSVQARKLYDFLSVRRDYSNWIKARIAQYGFEAGVDYVIESRSPKRASGNRGASTEHYLTLDMAKELAMVERNDKGREARRYFIECERRLKTRQTQTAMLPAPTPFHEQRRYLVVMETGRVTHMTELGDECLVPRQRVETVRRNLATVRDQLAVLIGEASADKFDVPVVAFKEGGAR